MLCNISRTGPGAPPCSGPFSAQTPATTAETMSEPVEATTRAASVDAFMPWSITVTRYVLSASTARGDGGRPRAMRRRSSA